MAISDHYYFQQGMVDLVPTVQGVYFLWQGDELIYIGRAVGEGVSIKSRLNGHLAGRDGPCTQAATTFTYEARLDGKAAEVSYLNGYHRRMGRLPRCNDRIG